MTTPSASIRRFLYALLLVLPGCAISILKPADNDRVFLPTRTAVAITGNANYTDLRVAVDGTDVSSQITPTGTRKHEGAIALAAGAHTVTASATIDCPYCLGGTTRSSDSKSFVVDSGPRVCGRTSGAPIITIDSMVTEVGQRPGRQLIAYAMKNAGDGVLIIVDDAPGLLPTQMRVEIDIDPFNGVDDAKAIEAWGFCRSGSRVGLVEASKRSVFNEGTICSSLTAANNFRSGCTLTQMMLLDQTTTQELWFRKPGVFGWWTDAEAMDESFWKAFGGRSVRFIWRFD